MADYDYPRKSGTITCEIQVSFVARIGTITSETGGTVNSEISSVEDEETADIVESGVALGNQLEIGGIPTFLINGTLVSGALSGQQLENLVRQALDEAP